jgi:hypothetical protein
MVRTNWCVVGVMWWRTSLAALMLVSYNEIMGELPDPSLSFSNVANMVVSTDMNLMAALQYAVNVLKVPPHYRLWSL